MVVVKPWSPDFPPSSHIFNKILFLARLPYLPLHLWFDTLLEVAEKPLGYFLMGDELCDDMMYTTFVGILVEMDISKGLPEMIMLKHSCGSWI